MHQTLCVSLGGSCSFTLCNSYGRCCMYPWYLHVWKLNSSICLNFTLYAANCVHGNCLCWCRTNLLYPSFLILPVGVCLSRQFYMRVSSLCLLMSVHCIWHHVGALLVVPDSLTRHKFSSVPCLMI